MRVALAAVAGAALAGCSGCLVGFASHLEPGFAPSVSTSRDGSLREIQGDPLPNGATRFVDDGLTLLVGSDPRRILLQIANGTGQPLVVEDAEARLSRPDGTTVTPGLTRTRGWRVAVGGIAPGEDVRFQACVTSRHAGPRELECQWLLPWQYLWVEGPKAEAADEARALEGIETTLVLPVRVGGERRVYHVRLTVTSVQVTRKLFA